MLTHLAAIFIQDMSQTEHVLIGGLIEDQGTDRHQGIEPTASLINRFTNKISGIGGFKLFY